MLHINYCLVLLCFRPMFGAFVVVFFGASICFFWGGALYVVFFVFCKILIVFCCLFFAFLVKFRWFFALFFNASSTVY